MDLYREMMDNGFLIYQQESSYRLSKIPTKKNPSEKLPRWTFDSFEEALDEVKKLIDWKDQKVMEHVQDSSTHWHMELMYRHKGLGSKYASLGELGSTSYENACIEAKKRAEAYIAQSNLEDYVDGFDVRVRPFRSR